MKSKRKPLHQPPTSNQPNSIKLKNTRWMKPWSQWWNNLEAFDELNLQMCKSELQRASVRFYIGLSSLKKIKTHHFDPTLNANLLLAKRTPNCVHETIGFTYLNVLFQFSYKMQTKIWIQFSYKMKTKNWIKRYLKSLISITPFHLTDRLILINSFLIYSNL